MKKLVFLTIALCFIASFAYAQAPKTPAAASATTAVPAIEPVTVPATEPAIVTLNGTIIDNMCAGTQKPEELAAFVKTHTKECALKCAPSGYAIFANGKLSKFDKDSNVKVEEFLKKADSKTDVVVVAKEVNGELSLVSIGNQPASK
jgi:hypothetical protein